MTFSPGPEIRFNMLKVQPVRGDDLAYSRGRIGGGHLVHRLRLIPSSRFWMDLDDFWSCAFLMWSRHLDQSNRNPWTCRYRCIRPLAARHRSKHPHVSRCVLGRDL
jgi:hypothetical protein